MTTPILLSETTTGARLPRESFTIPARVAERAAKRHKVDSRGCWASTYSVASHGYAQIGWHENGKRFATTAHRAAWAHYHGPIPDGMTVDHLCRNRRCVRREHLRLLENFENARRTFGRDWPLGQCVNGHPNSELYLADGGRRTRCRSCQRDVQRRYRARRRKEASNGSTF